MSMVALGLLAGTSEALPGGAGQRDGGMASTALPTTGSR